MASDKLITLTIVPASGSKPRRQPDECGLEHFGTVAFDLPMMRQMITFDYVGAAVFLGTWIHAFPVITQRSHR